MHKNRDCAIHHAILHQISNSLFSFKNLVVFAVSVVAHFKFVVSKKIKLKRILQEQLQLN